MKMKNGWKKAAAFLTALALVTGGLPANVGGGRLFGSKPIVAYAEGEWSKFADGVTTFGISDIGSPNASNTSSAWQGSYVYYGQYNGTPTKYRVLVPNTDAFQVTGGSLFLDCNTTLYNAKFHGSSNVWASSSVRSGLQGDAFLNKDGVFTSAEKTAIVASKTNISSGTTNYLNHTNLDNNGEQVFLLDVTEVTNASYGYAGKNARKKSGVSNYGWWLRSPSQRYSKYAGFVYCTTDQDILYEEFTDDTVGVSPAFNVDPSSVLFSSKVTDVDGDYGDEYKLTLKDSNTAIEAGTLTRSGDTVTVPYTVADSDDSDGITADTVSVLITDADGAVKYYAPLTGDYSANSSGTFDVPADYANTDTVYILAEDVNSQYLTDYASDMVEITVPPDPAHFSQDGDTYTLHDATGWEIFCECVQDTANYNGFSGKTVVLGADISTSTMAGDSSHIFQGTFDGAGHTLTVTYNNNNNNIRTAPFSYTNGAVIQNLRVSGNIKGNYRRAAGIAGTANNTKIINCVSNATITGDRFVGGFIVEGSCEIIGSVFNGYINTTGDGRCGGFSGYNCAGITNCLYAPKSGSSVGYAFSYYSCPFTNAYYLNATTRKAKQGKSAHTISAGSDVSLSVAGEPIAEYNLSGIKAYTNGIEYNGVFYAGLNDEVSLTLSHADRDGYSFNGYTASAGNLADNKLTMPDSDVTVNADFEEIITYTLVPAKPATYTEAGNSEYYEGSDGKYYVLENGEYTQITQAETVIPKLQPSMNIVASGSKYDLNVYIPIAEGAQLSDYTVTFGDEVQTLKTTEIGGKSYGIFTVKAAAKDMTAVKELVIKQGETTLCTKSVSAAGYLKQFENDATFGNMAKSMLRYGGAAQKYFIENVADSELANAGVEGYGLDSLTNVNITDNSPSVADMNTAFALTNSEYYGMNMTFDSDTSLLIAFKIKTTAEDAKSELEAKFTNAAYTITCEPDNSGKYIIVKVANIPIKKLGDTLFTFNNGNVNVDIKATDYLARIANNSDKSDNLRNLCKALYKFYESTK